MRNSSFFRAQVPRHAGFAKVLCCIAVVAPYPQRLDEAGVLGYAEIALFDFR